MSEEKENQEPMAAPEKPAKTGGNKPVVIYILILFVAAFLLMTLSLLMHQRSNTEALGQLQSSVSAIQEVQADQEKIIQLQEELNKTKEALDIAGEELEAASEEADALRQQTEAQEVQVNAFRNLYILQQWYSGGRYTACQELIESMESDGTAAALPSEPYAHDNGTVTAPSVRFQQLKEAVETQLAKQG